jgi:DNA-binding NarL/FixJ family response regulator
MILSSQADMAVVGQAATSPEAIAEFRLHKPDVMLIDQRLPGAPGTEALITIREEFPLARIIMLTTCDGDLIIQRALRAGAASYVLKSTPKSELGIARLSVESSGSGLTHFTMPFCGSQELTYQGRQHPAL